LPSGDEEPSEMPGTMIDRACFDRAIARRATRAGTTVWTSTRLIDLDSAERTAHLRTAHGNRPIRYSVLIAADGPYSTTAARLGLQPLEVVHTRQHTVRLTARYEHTDIWLSDRFPGGYGWLFPKGTLANIGVGVDRRWMVDLKTALVWLHRSLVDDDRVEADVLGLTGGAIPVNGLRDRLAVGRVLFVGDAAGLAHPISGAGIAAAVISGERAGEAAAEFVRDGRECALSEFEQDIREQYEGTLRRALDRRAILTEHRRTAGSVNDRVMRRSWIAFREYFDA
jgi:digeranylgeranylglycerophospholipid reductase